MQVPFQIKLLKYALDIMERYSTSGTGKVFELPSYENVNKKIKIVGKLCGINKKITFHLARHTFATLALSKGMPIESVSKILGHSNITTTQIYAKVINTKLENDLEGILDFQTVTTRKADVQDTVYQTSADVAIF